MKKTQPISAWLDVLSTVFPPRNVLVVGAGSGNGPWVQWLRHSGVQPVWLVEGDDAQYQHLSRGSEERWILRQDVVAATAGPVTFHRASNPAESGLIAPERLRELWPNLESVGAKEIGNAVTLETLFAEAKGDTNWLVLDCLPVADLLQGGVSQLPELDLVLIRVVVDDCFTDEPALCQKAADELLYVSGLKCLHIEAGHHPYIAHALYVRDTRRLTSQLEQAFADVRSHQQRSKELAWALQGVNQQLDEAKQANVHANAVEKALIEANERETEWLKRQDIWQQERSEMLAQYEALILEKNQLEKLNIGLHNLGRTIESSVQREVNNAVQQMESFFQLQHYIGTNTLLPEMHKWPISPDFGVLLIELIEQHNYDAVIEFGSGTSTLIIAKALDRVAQRKQQVPSPLLSFDHLEEYQSKSQRYLDRAGLNQHAYISLAPLVTWRSQDAEDFAYYSCGETLLELKGKLKAQGANILVVVDGPPASTGPLARYPALSNVLDVFGDEDSFHFLMDDYIRKEEQEIVGSWERILPQYKRPCRRTNFYNLEKMACLLEIFPLDSTLINGG